MIFKKISIKLIKRWMCLRFEYNTGVLKTRDLLGSIPAQLYHIIYEGISSTHLLSLSSLIVTVSFGGRLVDCFCGDPFSVQRSSQIIYAAALHCKMIGRAIFIPNNQPLLLQH